MHLGGGHTFSVVELLAELLLEATCQIKGRGRAEVQHGFDRDGCIGGGVQGMGLTRPRCNYYCRYCKEPERGEPY